MSAVRRLLANWLPAYAFLYIAFLYLPVLLLPIFSVNTAASPRFPLSGYTLKWYADLPNTPALIDATQNSLIVGIAASILATILGICAARAMTRYRFPGQRAVSGLIMAPLVLPEVIVAIALLIVLLQLGLSLSLFTVVLGHVLICVPYSVSVLVSGFEGFRPQPRRGVRRPRRKRLRHVPPRDAADGGAGHHLVAACLVHHLARRVHHGLLPDRYRADPADLHLGAVALCRQTAWRAGARHAAARWFVHPSDLRRDPAPPRRAPHQNDGSRQCLTDPNGFRR